jgi:hypothetical protein
MERKIAAVRGLPAEALAKAGPTRSTVQGSFVVRGVLLALLATVVLPPAAAWWLNSRRVAATEGRVAAAAIGAAAMDQGRVVCGPGRLPIINATDAVIDAGDASGREADAWGQCLLVGHGWVLSAGANGVVETPLDATTTYGDDIGARLR